MDEDIIGAGSVLAILAERTGARACLDGAVAVATAGSLKRIYALHVRVDPYTDILPTEEMIAPEQRRTLEVEAMREAEALHEIYLDWSKTVRRGLDPIWIDVGGGETERVATIGAQADISVIATPTASAHGHARRAFQAAIFDTKKPVVVVPTSASLSMKHAMIAWRDDDHARETLQAAIPYLKHAESVLIVHIGDAGPSEMEWASAALSLASIASRTRIDKRVDHQDPGAQILDIARAESADWIVSGAYRFGEIVEWLLGGTTDTLLAAKTKMLFLRH